MRTRTGLDGYCCAKAASGSARKAARTRRFMTSPSAMREHFLPGNRHFRGEDLAVQRIRDVERAAFRAAVGDVRQEAMMLAAVHEVGGQGVRVEAPHADAEMAHREPVLLVGLDAVRAGVAARELDRDAGLG